MIAHSSARLRWSKRRATAAIVLLSSVAACSGSSANGPPATTSATPATEAAETPATSTPADGGASIDTTATGVATAETPTGGEVTMLAYDSFVEPASLAEFTAATGITVTVARGGDTGTMVNKALLTAGNPEADVLWGLDSGLLSRAVDGRLFEPYESTELANLDPAAVALVPGREVTPVNVGDVCINYDATWFADRGIAPPVSLDSLSSPDYRGLLVVENPATSAPGLAFLFATVAAGGEDGWQEYWTSLVANDVLVVDSWDAAFGAEFTAGGGAGQRPIMVSYASSPPAGILFAPDPKPTDPGTRSVEATCFRQYEFAGVLRGSEHAEQARQLIDFLAGEAFQAELPESNFVYPARVDTPLPAVFDEFGRPAARPFTLDPAMIAANRDRWVEEWESLVIQ